MAEPSQPKKPRLEEESALDVAMATRDDAGARRCKLLSLPFACAYDGGSYFYERSCYPTYYALVESLLKRGASCVTVTGTPGIGTSVFYAFFADRYATSHADVLIIAVAVCENDRRKAAIVTHDGKPPTIQELNVEAFINSAVENALVENKRVLFLVDGPPPPGLPAAGQTVVFTSPDEKWLDAVDKLDCTYYMPLWSCEELLDAVRVLGLEITQAEVERRFCIFGGTARYCLRQNPQAVERATEAICTSIGNITELAELQNLLRGKEPSRKHHRILHYEPSAENRMLYKPQLASVFVQERMAARVASLSVLERQQQIGSWAHAAKVCQLQEEIASLKRQMTQLKALAEENWIAQAASTGENGCFAEETTGADTERR